MFAQLQHRQRSGTRHRHPAQLAPVNQAPAAGQKGQLQGLSFLQAGIYQEKARRRQQGRTEAAARGDPGRGTGHPLQLVPGEPGQHPAQLQAIRKGRSWYQVNQGSNQGANYQKAFIL